MHFSLFDLFREFLRFSFAKSLVISHIRSSFACLYIVCVSITDAALSPPSLSLLFSLIHDFYPSSLQAKYYVSDVL